MKLDQGMTFDIEAKHGRVCVTDSLGAVHSFNRAEALEMAMNLILAVQSAGDLSDIPSNVYNDLDRWLKSISADTINY